jgi:hypothetical protein
MQSLQSNCELVVELARLREVTLASNDRLPALLEHAEVRLRDADPRRCVGRPVQRGGAHSP